MLRRIRPDAAELKRGAVLVQRDEHFLRMRGERMTVERERHRRTFQLSRVHYEDDGGRVELKDVIRRHCERKAREHREA